MWMGGSGVDGLELVGGLIKATSTYVRKLK